MGYSNEEGAYLLLRTQLMKEIQQEIEKRQWSQSQAAEFLGVKQPRISEIYSLRIDKFSVELLVRYLYRLKKEVSLQLKDVD
ncbi:MAG: helix-turn-helix domain-containing protein [Candidatus Obscuribacterales bacterium]